MNGLKKEIAAINNGQWVILIILSMAVNVVILIGVVMLTSTTKLELLLAGSVIEYTRTPLPTFTSTPTNQPHATLIGTRVPTWTPTVTPTSADTATPTPRPTRRVIAASAAIAAIDLPSPTPTNSPTPAYDFVGTVRQMTPCENQGNHHIFAYVRDRDGHGIPNMRMRVSWPTGEAFLMTGDKMQDAGLADFAMFKGSYNIEVVGAGSSQLIGPISPDIPQNETCEQNGNTEANSLFHYSFEVIFTRMRPWFRTYANTSPQPSPT